MASNALKFVFTALATGLGVAYLTPVAKATLASFATIVVYSVVRWGETEALSLWLIVVIAITFAVGVFVSSKMSTDDDPDPSRVVIDEVAGQLAAVLLVPVELPYMVLAFLLFRLFDVLKPLGIRRLERIPNGWGIMLDDLAAGLLAAAIVNLAFWVANGLT